MQCSGSRPFLRFCTHHAPKPKVSSFTKMCKYCEIKFSENTLFRWRTVTQLKFESIPFLIITMVRVDSEDLRFLGETKCRFKNHHYNPKSLSLFLSKMRITITSGWIRNCLCPRFRYFRLFRAVPAIWRNCACAYFVNGQKQHRSQGLSSSRQEERPWERG